MTSMTLFRKVHKWLALLVGLQLLIWVTTGLLFTLVDSSKSRGQIYRAKSTQEQAPTLPAQFLSNAELAEKIPKNIYQQNILNVELKDFHHHWYYQVTTSSGRYLFSVITGEQLKVKEAFAIDLAQKSYQGPGTLTELTLLKPPIEKFSGSTSNIWQADFNDELNTQVYLSQNTGRILKHVNNVSAYNDILKLLHFMDYNQTGHFNSWWVITMAVLATLLSFTGLFWLINIYAKKFNKRFLSVS